jgi:glutaminase
MAKSGGTDLQAALDDIVGKMDVVRNFGRAGNVEALAEEKNDRFGIAVVTADGKIFEAGEAREAFPLQSIAKVFALTMALRACGDDVWKRVGREPSGDPFSSIIDLERFKGVPRNPFINAGALVTVDMVLSQPKGHGGAASVRDFVAGEIGGGAKLELEKAIVAGDGETSGFNNRSLAYMAKHFENFASDVEPVMKAYVEQCAIKVDCRQLALAGRYLIGGDKAKPDDRKLARQVNAMMLTCGQYDGAGDFAFRVGLPAKSGVGGGILAVAPGKASIAAWSPGLDDNGNSLLGTLALEQLAEAMDWSVFG